MKTKWYKSWKVHNLLAHPAMEVLSWFGAVELGNRLHDATLPPEAK
jgi:hypothetical protein